MLLSLPVVGSIAKVDDVLFTVKLHTTGTKGRPCALWCGGVLGGEVWQYEGAYTDVRYEVGHRSFKRRMEAMAYAIEKERRHYDLARHTVASYEAALAKQVSA